MRRQGLTLETLGLMMPEPLERRAVWYRIHKATTLDRITEIAKALNVDPRDLVM